MAPAVGVGYYYSLGSNNYVQSASLRHVSAVPRALAHILLDVCTWLCRRLNLTSEELEKVEVQQMTELWTTYGNDNNLTEIWFDGGALAYPRPPCHALSALSNCAGGGCRHRY